jgi:decaprenyl-phosphate phosphoribosyltransferase
LTSSRSTALVVSLIRAVRPKQWLKNLLVFAAPGAAGALTQGPILTRSGLAFVAFCLISSCLYLVNDVVDAPFDQLHPVKRNRPIAAGAISTRVACAVACGLFLAGEAIGLQLGWLFAISLNAYLVMALAYSLVLKRVPVVDIAVVAAGFVLRAIAGGAATGVPNSKWFLLLVSFGALFVVTGKRYADLHMLSAAAPTARRACHYSGRFLRLLALAASAATMAAYILWVFSHHARAYGILIPLSAVPFALAIMRYTFLVEIKRGGAPEDLFTRDRPLQLAVLAWLAVYTGGIYLASG